MRRGFGVWDMRIGYLVIIGLLAVLAFGIGGGFSPDQGPRVVQQVDVAGLGVLRLGQRVRHPGYGDGVVKSIELGNAETLVHIQFEDVGSKWLVVEFAQLTLIDQ